MVVAGDTIFIAGRPDIIRTQAEKGYGALILENPQQALDAWQGKKGALLWSVSAKDGRKLAEYKLKSLPVFDGMVAANAKLYVSTQDGHLLCMGN